MKATILTIFPSPAQRETGTRPTSAGQLPPARMEALVPATSANSNATPSIESIILQKLLAELDARAIARVQAPYLVEQPVRQTGLIRTLWALVWLLSTVLCVFVVKYVDTQRTAPTADPAQTQSINTLTATIGDQNKQFSKMIDSIENLANVVAAASMHTAALPAMLKRLGNDLKQAGSLPVHEASVAAPKPTSLAMIAPPIQPDSAGISMGGHHHPQLEDVVALPNVVVHHNYQGVMDYWLMPRIVSGARVMTKVVPIAQTNMGVFVHDVEEVRDYIVTPTGDWLAASESNQNQ